MSQRFFHLYKMNWYCRWCGRSTPRQKSERDGFCTGGKCKQALWRAFKKYRDRVTKASDRKVRADSKSNATKPKKQKAKGNAPGPALDAKAVNPGLAD